MIPQAAPFRRIARFRAAVERAITRTLESENYILGDAVAAFEAAFSARIGGSSQAVGVASGTDALALALRALGIGPGDEVILPAMTFAGSAQAVLHCGAALRLVDVDPHTRCIDPAAVSAAIGPRTRAMMPVHLHGHPADMPALMHIAERHQLAVIEDCAQAHGATLDGLPLGGFGHAAAWSFYPTKNLGAIGDGGAVTTRDRALADRIRSLRHYGFVPGAAISDCIGFNSRLDEMQAAILLALLPHLDEGNEERRRTARRYRELLAGVTGVGMPPESPGSVYHQFAITHPDRDVLMRQLRLTGVGTAIHYSPGLHRHPAFARGAAGPLPVTERLAATMVSLPIQPEVAADAVETIAAAVLAFAPGR